MSNLLKVILSVTALSFVISQANAGVIEEELSLAREATAKYHDVNVAMADGYVDLGAYVPMMGHHFMNFAYLDDTFEIDKPELLVYANSEADGKLRLVAVEYAIPLPLSAEAPEGFTGDEDHWHANHEIGLWTLHAWVWLHNKDGMFNATNSRVE
ncbi:hypothetical protein [Kangiella sp.]|uniref:hypothetical protein n=1 Tax=Kangiella sp. TaxID=1920245 RepID=UPI0019A974A2|nr:hypothetical protein [Kangiella sp.]MBD3653614.1 hypothetical protein [Kangiella sp.]